MGPGLNKINGRGKMNTCAKPRGDTKQVQVGNAFFVGKSAKEAQYLNAARAHWDARTNGSGKTTVGHQKPGSLKAR